AFMPDYAFKHANSIQNTENTQNELPPSWPNVSIETSLAGLLGGTITFAFVVLFALFAKQFSRRKKTCPVS
ncbi:MAG: PDGLE domain-containing protein, partial [Candidatus Nanoarchaeia archaeon]